MPVWTSPTWSSEDTASSRPSVKLTNAGKQKQVTMTTAITWGVSPFFLINPSFSKNTLPPSHQSMVISTQKFSASRYGAIRLEIHSDMSSLFKPLLKPIQCDHRCKGECWPSRPGPRRKTQRKIQLLPTTEVAVWRRIRLRCLACRSDQPHRIPSRTASHDADVGQLPGSICRGAPQWHHNAP